MRGAWRGRAGPDGASAGGDRPRAVHRGRSYFGRNEYIEYVAGNAPVILTAPHGGALVESHYEGLRHSAANRDRFGDATALVLEQYLYHFWGLALGSTPPLTAR